MQGEVVLLAHNTLILLDKYQVTGGANRDRTDDLLNAIQALSQLSYGPPQREPYDSR